MIRPLAFNYNVQTAVNNHYQNANDFNNNSNQINLRAQAEFDNFVLKLRSFGVEVIVFQDDDKFDTPDSVFPNNWISFHSNGDIALYPMFAENRRNERREDVVKYIEKNNYSIRNVIDYSSAEESNIFLEGTGSIVLDRLNRKAYCAISERSNEDLLIEFCEDFEYTPVIFNAFQTVKQARKLIYHTNVMMCIADNFVIICLDCIDDKKERNNVIEHLKEDGKEIVEISENQVNSFAGNMLQVLDRNNNYVLIMSESAYNVLTPTQKNIINKYAKIVFSSLNTIETYGGGSARCMMAEVFLSKAKQKL
ncbi:MAG: arginine deiminase-related protein [Flavobacteriaceae bacterium]|nr:arginine deiminase-related protein [Flavobacteriaceae bacterium]